MIRLLQGDCRDVLPTLPEQSVQCCITSPPYWGLRDYGTAQWEGGGADCDHLTPAAHGYRPFETSTLGPNANGIAATNSAHADAVKRQQFRGVCGKCGARRIDQQIGLERTPEEYVAKMVGVFSRLRRVLRDDGGLWLNLGDSYMSSPRQDNIARPRGATSKRNGRSNADEQRSPNRCAIPGLKAKDLVGIPWRVAFALQADGWYLRSDVIWHKPNPMPESVTDRPTKAHEYVFLLSKSPRYFYDQDAAREPWKPESIARDKRGYNGTMLARVREGMPGDTRTTGLDGGRGNYSGRNARSVWTIATQPFSEAHFATFPEELVRRCMAAGTKVGDMVLDPFGGSGTVGLVADKMARHATLIDLSPEYIEMARQRIHGDAPLLAKVQG